MGIIQLSSMAKSWKEKFETARKPEVKQTDRPFAGIPAHTPFLISSPAEIAAYLRHLEPGQHTTPAQLRKDLAAEHGVGYTCPVTTGIFLRIVAECAWDEYLAGTPITAIVPFWRVIRPTDALASKLRCGPGFLAETA